MDSKTGEVGFTEREKNTLGISCKWKSGERNASENKWAKFQGAESDLEGTQVKNQKRILDKGSASLKVRGGHREGTGLRGLERKRRGMCRYCVRTGPSNKSKEMEHDQTKRETAKGILLILSSVFIKDEKTCTC